MQQNLSLAAKQLVSHQATKDGIVCFCRICLALALALALTLVLCRYNSISDLRAQLMTGEPYTGH